MGVLYILGCGGHARSIADTYLLSYPGEQVIFVDSNAKKGEHILGFELIEKLPEELTGAPLIIALGDNTQRRLLFQEHQGRNIISVASRRNYISPFATIGRGSFIGNLCHIGPEAVIGDNTIINTAAVIEHGVSVGKHTHIAPNVAISGNATIGNQVFIGVGATVIDKVSICDDVIIGAGSVVITSIIEPGTYVGCPARKIK
jgi:UDP-N-acetylbacillosamine N-acetyltransferase